MIQTAMFQSTPPTRRATHERDIDGYLGLVSIHAPHTEGDVVPQVDIPGILVSIHAPHTEGDNEKYHS